MHTFQYYTFFSFQHSTSAVPIQIIMITIVVTPVISQEEKNVVFKKFKTKLDQHHNFPSPHIADEVEPR